MIYITDEQVKQLKNEIPNIDEMVKSDDINALLLVIDDVILDNLDENDEPTQRGIELQRIYDQIYNQN